MIVALTLAASVPVLTAQEAQTLPVAEIAARVLGAAGAVVVDMERPTWPTCHGLCPPPAPKPEGPPPFDRLVFYTRAHGYEMDGWSGLCGGARIEVSFDAAGRVTQLGQAATYGAAGLLTRVLTESRAFTRQQAEVEARCAALPTTANFFRAPDPLTAYRAAAAVQIAHEAMLGRGSIHVACEFNSFGSTEHCATPQQQRDNAEQVRLDRITGVETDWPPGPYDTNHPAECACLQVQLGQVTATAEELNACVIDTLASLRVTKATYRQSRVVY